MLLLSLLAGLVLSGLDAAAHVRTASAQSKPPTDWSFYVQVSSTTVANRLGCNQGHFDASFSPVVSSEVFLDFGAQNSSNTGTRLINVVPATYLTYSQVEQIGEQFAAGYYSCVGRGDTTSQLKLALGTNNSSTLENSAQGSSWGQVVNTVLNWVQSHGYSSQVRVGGANDIEPNWDVSSHARAWVSGYMSATGAWYLDYGSADGCPTSTNPGNCANGWTTSDVYYVSWGAAAALALPEIYTHTQGLQWTSISYFGGVLNPPSKIIFDGPLDENDLDSSTYTSGQAWTELWVDINSYPQTATKMKYSAEVHNEPLS